MLLRLFLVGVGAAVFGSGCGEGFQSTESSTSSATNTGGSGGSGGSTGGAGGETAASGGAGGGVDPIVIVQAFGGALPVIHSGGGVGSLGRAA